jgi:hypothetical protein
MRLAVLLLTLTFSICCSSQTTPNGFQYFNDIVNPAGWPIPAHGRRLATELRPFGKNRVDVKAISYKVGHRFGLPVYYKNESGDLVLQSFYFNTRSFYAFELDGSRFGYGALVEGQGIGLATFVCWLDADGDGVFRRIAWGPDGRLEIPQWVLNKEKSDALDARHRERKDEGFAPRLAWPIVAPVHQR